MAIGKTVIVSDIISGRLRSGVNVILNIGAVGSGINVNVGIRVKFLN